MDNQSAYAIPINDAETSGHRKTKKMEKEGGKENEEENDEKEGESGVLFPLNFIFTDGSQVLVKDIPGSKFLSSSQKGFIYI